MNTTVDLYHSFVMSCVHGLRRKLFGGMSWLHAALIFFSRSKHAFFAFFCYKNNRINE